MRGTRSCRHSSSVATSDSAPKPAITSPGATHSATSPAAPSMALSTTSTSAAARPATASGPPRTGGDPSWRAAFERLVLDFFAGSGTTGEAAAGNGRAFLLVDNNPEAVGVMCRRLERFGPEVPKAGCEFKDS